MRHSLLALCLFTAPRALALDIEVADANPADWSFGKEFGHVVALADLECDGVDDLVVGAPYAWVDGRAAAGAVFVILDGSVDVNGSVVRVTQRNGSGPEANDHFGWSIGVVEHSEWPDCGDALVIGAPDEDYGNTVDAGAISFVLSHRDFGQDPNHYNQTVWARRAWEAGAGETWEPSANARFGHAVAITGDGWKDRLVVSAPDELDHAGVLHMMDAYPILNAITFDPANAHRTFDWTRWDRSDFDEGEPRAWDHLGWSLATIPLVPFGDRDHLAIGVPGWDVGGVGGAGAVLVTNYIKDQPDLLHELLVDPVPRFEGSLGLSLAGGDFDGDERVDLAAGGFYDATGSGQVLVWTANLQYHYNDPPRRIRPNHAGSAIENHDHFGRALAAADLDRDGYDELAIGSPLEDRGNPQRVNAGMVSVMFGSRDGLSDWIAFGPDRARAPAQADELGTSVVAARGVLFAGMPGAEWSSGVALRITDF